MFPLELDLRLTFDPPMSPRHVGGVILTRRLELPFPAYDGLRVFAKAMDDCPDPMGFELKEVVWDLERGVFLAHAYLSNHGLPMGCIASELRGWLRRGWRFGSYRDAYQEQVIENDGDRDDGKSEENDERLPARAPRRRSREFNQLFKALIRHLVESFDAEDVAFAMDTTGRYYTEEQCKVPEPKPSVAEWEAWRAKFDKLSARKRDAWRERVAGYPSIEEVVSG